MRLLFAPRLPSRRAHNLHGRLREHHLEATTLGAYVLVLFLFILAVKIVFTSAIVMGVGDVDDMYYSDHARLPYVKGRYGPAGRTYRENIPLLIRGDSIEVGDGRVLTLHELERRLRFEYEIRRPPENLDFARCFEEGLGCNPRATPVIVADRDTPMGDILPVIEAARRAGYEEVRFMTVRR